MSTPLSRPHPGPADHAAELDFEGLYAQHFGFVWRCLRGLGVAPHAIDDAAQEVFVVVHRRLPEFRGESTVATWLYAIVRNVAANQRRSERRKPNVLPLQPDLACPAAGPLEHAQDQQAAEFVQAFLAGLGDDKRQLFILVLLEGVSVTEVATSLGIPLNTAYTRLRNVRLEFQRAMAGRGDGT